MSVSSFKNPHIGHQVMLESNRGADSYDAAPMPTPFLIGGFAPGTKPSQIKQQQQQQQQQAADQPKVTVKPTPKLTTPVSVVFTPPSLNIPSSAGVPDTVQIRPRSRSHEATSPRAAVVSPRSRQVEQPVGIPEPRTRVASPLHADDGFLDFFSSASASKVSSTATTAASSPVVTHRTLRAPASDSDDSDEEERARAKAERKAARKAAKKAEAERAEREAKAAALKEKERAEREKEKAGSKKSSKKSVSTPEQLAQAAKWLAEVDFYWIQHQADLSSSTGFGFTKHQVTWRFVLDDRLHELELFHSKFSGKRRIRLDSVELVNEKILFDSGSMHEIFIGEHLLKVVIYMAKSPLTFGYDLMIEGLEFRRAKSRWIQETKQRLTGTQYETKDLKAKKQEKFQRESALIDDQDVAYATTAIKQKNKHHFVDNDVDD